MGGAKGILVLVSIICLAAGFTVGVMFDQNVFNKKYSADVTTQSSATTGAIITQTSDSDPEGTLMLQGLADTIATGAVTAASGQIAPTTSLRLTEPSAGSGLLDKVKTVISNTKTFLSELPQRTNFIQTAHADSCTDTADVTIKNALSLWLPNYGAGVPCQQWDFKYTQSYEVYNLADQNYYVKVTLSPVSVKHQTQVRTDAQGHCKIVTDNPSWGTRNYYFRVIQLLFDGSLHVQRISVEEYKTYTATHTPMCSYNGTKKPPLSITVGDVNKCPYCGGKK